MKNLILFPLRLLWNVVIIIGVIWLQIIWLSFIFGSVVGAILLLIFLPEGFIFPLGLLVFVSELWPENE